LLWSAVFAWIVISKLTRLDIKNWTPTPVAVRKRIGSAIRALASKVDAMIVLDQVDLPETGVVTRQVLATLKSVSSARPGLPILADSRQRLRGFPPLNLKMNAVELARFIKARRVQGVTRIQELAVALARRNRRAVFVTLAERGIVGALPSGEVAHVPALPLRGQIDIVGAGDSVAANLTAAVAAGATLREALEIASVGASVVIHQLGTTGTASVRQIGQLIGAGA
jgi:bifunctional ADP-heptose synthase (sugar kinase/adenylyltransferase)